MTQTKYTLPGDSGLMDRIGEIRAVRNERERLDRLEAELAAPLLSDLDKIDRLYAWFAELQSARDLAPRIDSVAQRKKFLFVILRLYSPASLAGGKMTRGLRDKLAEVFGLHSRTTVSDNCADIVFFYQHYKEFREEVNHLYSCLAARLEEDGGGEGG